MVHRVVDTFGGHADPQLLAMQLRLRYADFPDFRRNLYLQNREEDNYGRTLYAGNNLCKSVNSVGIRQKHKTSFSL